MRQSNSQNGTEKCLLLLVAGVVVACYLDLRGEGCSNGVVICIRGAHTCALYEVAKHTLVDEVRLFISLGGLFCSTIVLAHVAKQVRGLHIQLFNHFFVILQFTRGIFGVLLAIKKFLTTDHHLWMDLIYRRRLVNHKQVTQRECQYNACHCGSKLHSLVAQCHTYLRGTQNGIMQGTLINSTFRAVSLLCTMTSKLVATHS